MALSPADALAQRQQKRAEQITALEARVDQTLPLFLDSGECAIDVDATTNHVVVDEIVNRYRAVGWTVDTQQDFHGNKRLVFVAP